MTGECECCGYKMVEISEYRRDGTIDERWSLCSLCASTLTSTRVAYHHEDADVLQAICYVGNAILAAIRENQSHVGR